MKIQDKRAKPASLMILTPFLDVLTVLLIFLIVTFAPDQASVQIEKDLKLPQSAHSLRGIPHVKVQVSADAIKVNGEVVQGLNPSSANSSSWEMLKAAIKAQQQSEEKAVLLLADKETAYRWVDMAAAHLSASGFSEVYLLTEIQQGDAK